MTHSQILWYADEALKSITPLAIGVLGIWIARKQWRTGHLKLKQDLFDRRLKVYHAVVKPLSVTGGAGSVSDEVYFDLIRAVGEAEFLFPKATVDFSKNVLEACRKHRSYGREIERANDNLKIAALDIAQNNLEIEMERRFSSAIDHFRPYLDFRDIR